MWKTCRLLAVDYRPDTPLEEGLRKFVNWYKAYLEKQELEPLAESA
jgi:nucleoside-diphosphate-sugar epimerase